MNRPKNVPNNIPTHNHLHFFLFLIPFTVPFSTSHFFLLHSFFSLFLLFFSYFPPHLLRCISTINDHVLPRQWSASDISVLLDNPYLCTGRLRDLVRSLRAHRSNIKAAEVLSYFFRLRREHLFVSDINGGVTLVGGAFGSSHTSHHKRPTPSLNPQATVSSSSSSSSSSSTTTHHTSSEIHSSHDPSHSGGGISLTQTEYDLLVNPTNAQLSQSLRLEYAKEKHSIRALFRYADR